MGSGTLYAPALHARGHGVVDRQATFEDLAANQYVRSLGATQIDIIRLLEQGDYQAHIARRLGKSRSYVCQIVRRLESYGLLVARRLTFSHEGKTHTVAVTDPLQGRATGYIVTPRLQALLAQNPHKDGSYTLCTPHHLKIKIPILDQNRSVVTTGWRQSRARSVHVRSWRPRGPERHLFHVVITGSTIGVEYHGSSLVAYRVERTHLLATDVNEATAIAAAQIQDGVARFVEEQGWSGVRITLGTPQVIDRPHFAFPSGAAKQVIHAGQRLATPGVYCDDSLARQDVAEIETTDPILATQIDRGLRNALNIEPLVERSVARGMVESSKTLLDGFCQHLAPIQSTLGSIYETANTVLAHVQGGTTLEYQFTQIVTLLSHTLNTMQDLQARIEDLERRTPSQKSRGKKKNDTKPTPPKPPASVRPATRGADVGTDAGCLPQDVPEMPTGLPAPAAPAIPIRPAGSAPGGDPVCLHDLSRPAAGRGAGSGRRTKKAKKR